MVTPVEQPRRSEIEIDDNFEYITDCGEITRGAKTTFGILLIGGAETGSEGERAATQWFLERADKGNYLVIRSDEIGEQALWICDHFEDYISSASELSIQSYGAANHPDVIEYVRNADALFISGGDQNEYEDYWKDSALEDAVNYLINDKKIPVAGTSAGMAILGDYYYAPAHDGLLCSEILNNPFHRNTNDIYRSDFIRVPFLKNVITDTHLDRPLGEDKETRYGRIFGLLARVVHDNNNQLPSYAIGLEEGAFVAIDENGIAKVFGNGRSEGEDAYFIQTNGALPEQIAVDLPLIWDNDGQAVKVYRISGTPEGSGSFNLKNWFDASGGTWEYWYTTGGMSGFQREVID